MRLCYRVTLESPLGPRPGLLQLEFLDGRIGGTLSLLGFDNIHDSGLPRINLTTVEQPMKMLASVAVDSLLDKIQNELSGYTHRILTPTLVERSSCAPYHGK